VFQITCALQRLISSLGIRCKPQDRSAQEEAIPEMDGYVVNRGFGIHSRQNFKGPVMQGGLKGRHSPDVRHDETQAQATGQSIGLNRHWTLS